jgi:pilus assembly protein Flp/PilA
MTFIQRFVGDRRGVTFIEYALIAALVAVACFSILQTMGTRLTSLFTMVSNKVSAA